MLYEGVYSEDFHGHYLMVSRPRPRAPTGPSSS